MGATVIAFGAFGAFASWGFFLAGTAYGTAEQWYGAAVATLVFAIVSFSALSGLAYGLTAPFLEVTAEATPPGSWETHLFEAGAWTSADGTHASRPAFLSHSAAYADETVLDSIACWMAAQGGGRAATPAKGESASTQLAAGRGGR